MAEKNVVLELSISFALGIMAYCELLDNARKYVVAQQLLKSGTSIGANINEAQHAESRADFIHKLKIAAKEAGETSYWLLLCNKSTSYPNPDESLNNQLTSIQKLLSSIISKSKNSG